MVRHQGLGRNDLGCFHGLLNGHRIGLVHRQECQVNLSGELFHLGDYLGVAGHVNLESCDINHVTVVFPRLGMELGVAR